MKKIGQWLVDKWLGGFITAVIIFFSKAYYDLPVESKKHFFNFSWLRDIFELRIPAYLFIIVLTIIILITRIEKSLVKKKFTKSKPLPRHLNASPHRNVFEKYNSDVFGARLTKWTWDYKWDNLDRKWIIENARPMCPKHDIPMDIRENSFYVNQAECYKCRLNGRNGSYELKENPNDIVREVVRKINNNEIPLGRLN